MSINLDRPIGGPALIYNELYASIYVACVILVSRLSFNKSQNIIRFLNSGKYLNKWDFNRTTALRLGFRLRQGQTHIAATGCGRTHSIWKRPMMGYWPYGPHPTFKMDPTPPFEPMGSFSSFALGSSCCYSSATNHQEEEKVDETPPFAPLNCLGSFLSLGLWSNTLYLTKRLRMKSGRTNHMEREGLSCLFFSFWLRWMRENKD